MGSAWLDHVKNTMKSHPGLKLKEVLKIAAKSYKKGSGAVSSHKKVHKRKHRRTRRKSRKHHSKKKGKKKGRKSRRRRR